MANQKLKRSVKMSDITTNIFTHCNSGLELAANILKKGGLLAFPTETVYGLGADATNDIAVARIYEAKGRPSFNPLIVHFADISSVKTHVIWPKTAQLLATAFWPGALTFVLEKRPESPISRLTTAGLPNVAVRVPAHPVAESLLRIFGGPVAAPSANLSGAISPTCSEHVKSGLLGSIEGIIDGGQCGLGLESTIVDLTDQPKLLRPGSVTAEAIENVLSIELAVAGSEDGIKAPGQLISHYAPKSLVRLDATKKLNGEVLLGFGNMTCDLNLSPTRDLTEAAANLFAFLHQLDTGTYKKIAVANIPKSGVGYAINDRLKRAAAPRDE